MEIFHGSLNNIFVNVMLKVKIMYAAKPEIWEWTVI